MKRRLVAALLVLMLMALGFVAGAVYTMRAVRLAEQRQGQTDVPWRGCDVCYELYPDWLCWLSGCP